MHVDLARVQFGFTSINAGRPHHRPRRPAVTPDAARVTVRRYGPLGEREGCVFAGVVGWQLAVEGVGSGPRGVI